jgi:helicase
MIYTQNTNREKIQGLLSTLRRQDGLSLKEYKELLERTHSFLLRNSSDDTDYNLGLSVICHVGDKKVEDPLICQLLIDCIVQSRVFLYADMTGIADVDHLISDFDIVGKELYTLEISDTVLTRDQKVLFDLFQTRRRIVVSAPTSFGKSRIVQELIIHNDYKNVLIVLPTIALLNETFVKLKANQEIVKRYKIYNSLGSKDTRFEPQFNIFILTPEKSDVLLDRHNYLCFDFFTMDEIYKVQEKDDRGKIFTNCLYRLSKIPGINFYLIGPYFSGFSEKFLGKTQAIFKPFESEIVQKDNFDIDGVAENGKYKVNGQEIKKLKDARKNLRNIFKTTSGQSIIYHGRQKYSTENTAKFLIEHGKRQLSAELIDYIAENVAKDWSLVNCLKAGVAFHHGSLPKYIQTEIIDLFNNGQLDAIVCTSTIVEGVNTTAKNVIIYDQYKGPNELSGFDVKNIKGRAGRFLSHFIGNIYSMVPLQHEQNKGVIDFSFYDNEALDAEDTLQIDRDDLEQDNLSTRNSVEELLKKKNVPIELIRANKFVKVHQQLSLIDALRADPSLEELYFSSIMPTGEQLDSILYLCFLHLFNDHHREDRSFTLGNLQRLTKYYVFLDPSLKELISNFSSDNIDTRVRNAFGLVSEYFEFALPKYLVTYENIFNFVLSERLPDLKPVSFTYLITKMEFGQSEEHEIALKEAGLPNDIIRKIGDVFKDCSTLQQIRYKFEANPGLIRILSPFEQKIFKRYI